jgi:hypothetical protein
MNLSIFPDLLFCDNYNRHIDDQNKQLLAPHNDKLMRFPPQTASGQPANGSRGRTIPISGLVNGNCFPNESKKHLPTYIVF